MGKVDRAQPGPDEGPCPLLLGEGAAAAAGVEGTPDG